MEERLYAIINKIDCGDSDIIKAKTELEAVSIFCEEREIYKMTMDEFFEKYKTFVVPNRNSH